MIRFMLNLALIVACAAGAAGQDRVRDLLSHIPSQDAGQRPALLARLDALTVEDIEALCGMLVEPGRGEDVLARVALHAVALRASANDALALRERFAAGVAAYLRAERAAELRRFLVDQLALAGGNRTVLDLLGRMLGQADIVDEAARALVHIGGDEARAALRGALSQAAGKSKLVLLSALATLGDTASAEAFAAAAQDTDTDVRGAGIAGLAAIGDKRALPALQQMLASQSPAERGRATELLIGLAGHAARNWQITTATEMLRAPSLSQLPVHERAARLDVLAQILKKGAVPDLVEALSSPDAELRAAAAAVAVRLEGAAPAVELAAKLASAPPEARVAIIEILAARGEKGMAIFGAVMAALRDQDERVRIAAVRASIGVSEQVDISRSLQAIVTLLESAGPAELGALEETLTKAEHDGLNAAIASAQQATTPRMRVCLLRVLANRGAVEQLDVVRTAIGQTDPDVRVAAIRAIGVLADESEAMNLIELLLRSPAAPERAALEEALAGVCSKAPTREMAASGVLATVQPENELFHASIVRVLGKLGGDEAWQVIRQALDDQRAAVRAAGLDAVGAWSESSAVEELLELARGRDDVREHALLMRAVARLIADDKALKPAARISLLSKALGVARRADERRMLLARIGEIADPAAFEAAKPLLNDADVRAEAAAAIVTLAEKLAGENWRAVQAALAALPDEGLPDGLRERLAAVCKTVDELDGFVTAWSVAGPFSQAGKGGRELMDVAFPPESGDPKTAWKPQPVKENAADYWRIDLLSSAGAGGGRDSAAYLCTKLHSPKAQEARLELGSDDGLKVWLNGGVVHANNALRGCQRNQDQVSVNLKEGWNTILLKVTNAGGGWDACLRVRAPDGTALPGLRYEAGP